MLAGVPQGSTLLPLLYNLYITDIPQSSRSELAKYANDVCIYKNIARNLRYATEAVQKHLSDLESGPRSGELDKTKCIIFTKLRKLESYGQETGFTKRAAYLGLTLHHRLNWKLHCNKVWTRAVASLRADPSLEIVTTAKIQAPCLQGVDLTSN